jgi:hypothetical protein
MPLSAFDEEEDVVVPVLRTSNNPVWRLEIRCHLIAKGLWDAVVAPDEKPVSKQVDAMAHAWIGLTVDDYHLLTVERCKSAREAWLALQQYFKYEPANESCELYGRDTHHGPTKAMPCTTHVQASTEQKPEHVPELKNEAVIERTTEQEPEGMLEPMLSSPNTWYFGNSI